MLTMTREVKLLKKCLKGDPQAFEVIVSKYQELICAITFSATADVQQSEELAHQTFINAWKNLSQLKELARFRPWLCTIARNNIRNFINKNKRDIIAKAKPMENINDTAADESGPLESAIKKERQALVRDAIQQIPQRYREPLVLYYRRQQSIKQVALSLDLSESVVRQRLLRGRKMIKAQLSSIVEETLSTNGPKKAFTTAVMASVTAIAIKGSGAAAVAGSAATTSTVVSTGAGVTTVLSTITAKFLTTVAVVAIGVGATVTYKVVKNSPATKDIPEQTIVTSRHIEPDDSPAIPASESSDKKTLISRDTEYRSTDTTDSEIPTEKSPNQTDGRHNPESVNLDPKPQPATTVLGEKSGRPIKVYVTDRQSDKPIEKATVYTFDGRDTFGTNENGYCQLHWDKDKDRILKVRVKKDGYVRMSYSVRSENTPGDKPIEIHFAMEKGTTIGGVVQNPDGLNLAGVDLKISVNYDEHMEKPENDVYASVTTDPNGKWEFDAVPAQLEVLSLAATHVDYAKKRIWIDKAEDIRALRSKEYVLVIDAGYSIHGTVKDESGTPIKGARVQLGEWYGAKDRQHRTHTDKTGSFEFNYLDVGNTGPSYEFVEGQGKKPIRRRFENVTVSAKDFAPASIKAFFKEKQLHLEFVLTEGSPVYGRVVDTEGNPVAGARVRADEWRYPRPDSIRSLDWKTRTDSDGRFVWQHAPEEVVELAISKDGFMTLEAPDITPLDTEYEFVLNDKLRVTGQVIDAVSKEPVTEFIIRRYEGEYRSTMKKVKEQDGKFATAFAHQGEKFTISFEADGYTPKRSREILLGEQDVELLIEMVPDAGIDGIVVDANGMPLEGVRVIIPKGALHLDDMKYEYSRLRYHRHALTDATGSFHFDPIAGNKYSFLVLEETGYVYVHAEDFPENGKLVLQPYGRIVGNYYKGDKPVANERIRVDYPNYHFNGMRNIAVNYGAQTDNEGNFVFDKLIAGTVRFLTEPYKEVEIKAGETIEIYLGGDGLTVTGHVLNPEGEPLNENLGDCSLVFQRIHDRLPFPEDEWPLPEDADAMSYGELMVWFTEFVSNDKGRKWLKAMEQKYDNLTGHYSFDIDNNGRFEKPNVKPGMYLFSVSVRPWKNSELYPRRTDYNGGFLARASKVFIVPEFETLEEMAVPIDLGTLQCRKAPLEVGMKAPEFEIEKLKSDGKIRLGDYRGKKVLVNFTKPAMKEIEPDKAAALSQVCEQIKTLNDVTIINVAMEMIPWDYMRKKMSPECTLPGIYGVGQMHNSKIHVDYELGQLPVSVLIGPDGTIIWKGVPGSELLDVLTEKLL